MKEDLCKELRDVYDKCFQSWLDTDYFQNKVKGPMVPCEAQMKSYHECLRLDPKRSAYLESLQENKEKFNLKITD